jgi:Carboxypeptidase regulatory-like domain
VCTQRTKFSWLVLMLMLVPTVARAQVGIAGHVKDATGGVLPGVTVEASSPALIEKSRTSVTDNQGQYKLIDLTPGIYSVAFTLPGFNTVLRGGIELSGSFIATVDIEMRVGAMEETITVSAANPVVDVQNVIRNRVFTTEVIDALPTARTYQGLAAVVPGVIMAATVRTKDLTPQDVGGSGSMSSFRMSVYGGESTDLQNMIDGIANNTSNGVANAGLRIDTGSMQEYNLQLSAFPAEVMTGGVHINMIPKEGGNRFAGSVFGGFSNSKLQSNNLTAALRAFGLDAVNRLDKVWDLNGSFGGPIKQDRLWFYASSRYMGLNSVAAGAFYDTNPRDLVYTPDRSRPAIDDQSVRSVSVRPTWQVNRKNKVLSYFVRADRCLCHSVVSTVNPPEVSTRTTDSNNHFESVLWISTITNRIVLEAGWSNLNLLFANDPQPEVTPDLLAVSELSTGLVLRAPLQQTASFFGPTKNYKVALAYVTGAHAFKAGFTLQDAYRAASTRVNGDMNLQLLNGVPRSVVVFTTPYTMQEQAKALGLFAQDQWTMKRLTLNLGVRFDYHNASVPEQHLPAAQFVPVRDFAAVPDVPNWKDVSPRLGVSYDLFGNAKTALKVSVSRYVNGELVGFARSFNPVSTSVNSATRTWVDANGDFVPQATELGPLSNANFGQVVIRTRFDEAIQSGWGLRPYNWMTSVGVDHQLASNVSMNVSYYRRWYRNFTVTDNLAVGPADYNPFCVTQPVDTRLPGGGGQQVCGLFDITPAKFGLSNNFVTFADRFGTQTSVYNGVDVTMNARFARGGLLSGGMNTGSRVNNRCFVIDSPEEQRFCAVEPPFQPQLKFLASYPLPRGFQISGTYQNVPGPNITASWVVPNDQIRGSLGRNLAAGANATKTVELIAPGTMFGDRISQVDVRLGKTVRVRRLSIQGNLDLYNLLNSSAVLAQNTTYGPQWLQPQTVMEGRLLRFSAQINF